MKNSCIKTWDEEERPREKLMLHGAASLTNTELLALLLRSGTSERSAVDLARELLAGSGGKLDTLSRRSAAGMALTAGIGPAKATSVAAAFELARRLAAELPDDAPPVRRSATVARMMGPLLKDLAHEECWIIYLNRSGKVTCKEKVSSGGQVSTVIDIKIIVKKAVERLASGIILVHNHPSGNPAPGEQDRTQTEALRKAAAVFDIALVDHIVIGGRKYYSFSDETQGKY
ncbi:MAG: DNA repair protein RadC [Bacteroidales bacterium]|nr:DNA repair protein RadC [Bacteroidales bacterium]